MPETNPNTNAQQKKVEVSAVLLFPFDFCPECMTISGGYVTIFGEKRTIARGIKVRNPDGSVNFVEVDII